MRCALFAPRSSAVSAVSAVSTKFLKERKQQKAETNSQNWLSDNKLIPGFQSACFSSAGRGGGGVDLLKS
jgi:hypothetical protein